VATLPEGKDPCDCLTDLGPDAFAACLDGAVSLWEFKLREADGGPIDPKRAAALADEVLGLVARVPNVVERRLTMDIAARLLVQRLGIAERAVRSRFGQLTGRRGRRPADRDGEPEQQRSGVPADEKELLAVCLQETELFPQLCERVQPADFTHDDARAIFEAAADLLNETGDIQPTALNARLLQPACTALLAEIMNDHNGCTDYEERLTGCLQKFDWKKARERLRQVKTQLLEAARQGDTDSTRQLQLEYRRLAGISRQLTASEED
jgi:DNA primase